MGAQVALFYSHDMELIGARIVDRCTEYYRQNVSQRTGVARPSLQQFHHMGLASAR